MKKVLKEVAKRDEDTRVDFILCMSDDVQGEKMFTSIFSFVAESEDVYYAITLPNEDDSDMMHIIPQDLVQSSIECPIMIPVMLLYLLRVNLKLQTYSES